MCWYKRCYLSLGCNLLDLCEPLMQEPLFPGGDMCLEFETPVGLGDVAKLCFLRQVRDVRRPYLVHVHIALS